MSLKFEEHENIGVITFDKPDSKANVLDSETLKRLDAMMDDVKGKTHLKAVVFKSAKNGIFIAGADIKEIEKITEADDGATKAKAGQDVFNKIEDLSCPTVAVINGAAMGGGCELALACDYRVATFSKSVRIGLPEVKLGFVPGFGGTYRLPRLVGLQEALKMILMGSPVDGGKALRSGLVDKLFPDSIVDQCVDEYVKGIVDGSIKPLPKPRKKKTGCFRVYG